MMPTTFLQDKQFFQTLLKLALPIAAQYFLLTSLPVIDLIMIGQLGETAVAAVGLADQIQFLVMLLLFGIGSGAAIFTAQYWGQQNIPKIHAVLGLCLLMNLLGSTFWATLVLLLPEAVLSIYSTDEAVIEMGSQYLRIVGLSYIATAITNSYATTLRSIEQAVLPMLVSILAISLNTVLNYGLIFGELGLPKLGVVGAAWATLLARHVECLLLVGLVYGRNLPVAASLTTMLAFDGWFLRRFLYTALPVIITEVMWSLGMTTYRIVYARISTEAIAAVNIVTTIERLAEVIFLGIVTAAAIMIGNRIGAGAVAEAIEYAKRFLILGPFLAVGVSLIVFFSREPFLQLYAVSPLTVAYTQTILAVLALAFPIKMLAFMVFIGVLRSGGDTQFAMVVDGGAVWLIGVPLAFWGAFVLEWPVYWVYLLVMTEEFCKVGVGLWRIHAQKWIHHLTDSGETT